MTGAAGADGVAMLDEARAVPQICGRPDRDLLRRLLVRYCEQHEASSTQPDSRPEHLPAADADE